MAVRAKFMVEPVPFDEGLAVLTDAGQTLNRG